MLILLRCLFGFVFMGSAMLKLFPIEAFETILINQAGISWGFAPIISRALIVIELVLGSFLIFGLCVRQVLIVSILLLVVFSVFLAGELISGNNAENCGCFGELIPLTSGESLVKNLVLIGMGIFLLVQPRSKLQWFIWKPGGLILAMVGSVAVFFLSPVELNAIGEKAEMDFEIIREIGFDEDIAKGEKGVLFLYANCLHCKQLAAQIGSNTPKQVLENLYVVIYGPEERVAEFVDTTNISHLKYIRSRDRKLMGSFNGVFPTLVEINNGQTAQLWWGSSINLGTIETVVGQ